MGEYIREATRDGEGAIEFYKGHGVWVPFGQTAAEIMEGAWVLERDFDVAPFTSRMMVSAILQALAYTAHHRETPRSDRRGRSSGSQFVSSRSAYKRIAGNQRR